MSDLAVEEPVETTEPEVEIDPGTGTEPEPVAESAPPDLYALLETEFGSETSDPALDAVSITAETLKDLPPEIKAFARAILRKDTERRTAQTDAATKRETELAEREAKIEANRRQANRERQALLDLSRNVKPPGPAPTVDPLSAEGMRAHIAHESQRLMAEAFAPHREQAEKLAKEEAWLKIVDKYPDLRNPKIGGDDGEFDLFFRNVLNAGRDTEKEGSVVTTELAADLFFSQRKAATLETAAARTATVRASERATANRAVGRSSGAGGADLYGQYRSLVRKGDESSLQEAMDLVAGNATLRARVLAEARA